MDNKEIFPVRWRAQTLKNHLILLKIYDKENQTYNINFPLKHIVQVNKIFKEIIGYSDKKTFLQTEWINAIYNFDKKDTKMKLLSNQDNSTFSLNFEDSSGININLEMSAKELSEFSKKINEVAKS
jgi:hypothetical protein